MVFTGTPLTGTSPLTVQFTDTSTGSPTSWLWNFGDGQTSTQRNASHIYSNAGTYTVSLRVTKSGKSDTETKPDYVTVTSPILHQATNIEGRTDITGVIEDAAVKQTARNYYPTNFILPSRIMVKSRLPDDQIFFFNGHGFPGSIQTNSQTDERFFAQNSVDGYDFDVSSSTYGNMKLAVFLACHTGETDPDTGNLVEVVTSKGASCAMGWTDIIVTEGAPAWSSAFWSAVRDGKSINQAHIDGINAAKDDPICEILEPPSVWQYCKLDNLYSQGSGCIHPLPEGMTYLLAQNIKSSISEMQSSEKTASVPIKSYQAQDQQTIRKFSNKEITPKYEKSTKYSYGTLDTYTVENETYKVNRNTGRIQSQYVNDIDSTTGSDIIDLNQGYSVAEAYAKEKSPEFWEDEKDKVIKTINQVAKDHGLVYSWRQYFSLPNSTSNDSPEIAGFNLIDVTLDARDGKVKSYHEWYVPRDTNLDLNPDISEEQAWDLVKKYFEDTGIGITDGMQKDNFRLFIVIDDINTQHLAWQFEIKQNTKNPEYSGGQIIVDAHDGQIVRDIRYG